MPIGMRSCRLVVLCVSLPTASILHAIKVLHGDFRSGAGPMDIRFCVSSEQSYERLKITNIARKFYVEKRILHGIFHFYSIGNPMIDCKLNEETAVGFSAFAKRRYADFICLCEAREKILRKSLSPFHFINAPACC